MIGVTRGFLCQCKTVKYKLKEVSSNCTDDTWVCVVCGNEFLRKRFVNEDNKAFKSYAEEIRQQLLDAVGNLDRLLYRHPRGNTDLNFNSNVSKLDREATQ